MPQLTLISWRDIPSQIVVRSGRQTVKRMLSGRFQEAIDRAAMRAGKTGSQDYLDDWQRSAPLPCGEDAEAHADAQVAALEAQHTDAVLLALVRNHGRRPDRDNGDLTERADSYKDFP